MTPFSRPYCRCATIGAPVFVCTLHGLVGATSHRCRIWHSPDKPDVHKWQCKWMLSRSCVVGCAPECLRMGGCIFVDVHTRVCMCAVRVSMLHV